MNEIIFLVEDADEGGFTARALGESIVTQAETLDELKKFIKDAVKCHFDAAPSVLWMIGCDWRGANRAGKLNHI